MIRLSHNKARKLIFGRHSQADIDVAALVIPDVGLHPEMRGKLRTGSSFSFEAGFPNSQASDSWKEWGPRIVQVLK